MKTYTQGVRTPGTDGGFWTVRLGQLPVCSGNRKQGGSGRGTWTNQHYVGQLVLESTGHGRAPVYRPVEEQADRAVGF